MRVAFITPQPADHGWVAGMATDVAVGLARAGCDVVVYTASEPHAVPRLEAAGIPVHAVDPGWRRGRWYSRRRMRMAVSNLVARAWATRALGRLLVAHHHERRYDVVYQFSTLEVFGLRRHLDRLPPLVVHPGVHAAGELHALRRERDLARRCEPWSRRAGAEVLYGVRAMRQRHDARLPAGFLAPSERFADDLRRDLRLDPARVRAVPNPIDLQRFAPAAGAAGSHQDGGPIRVRYVGRVSVRKGIDAVVALSHRLADLEGRVTLEVVGGATLWSDYRCLLDDLDAAIASYRGPVATYEVPGVLAETDVLVQPSTYEPFALTVGEALACGVPVVATNTVGATEGIDPACCRVVDSGDLDALEAAVRGLVADLESGAGPRLRALARAEAERRFDPATVVRAVHDVLQDFSGA